MSHGDPSVMYLLRTLKLSPSLTQSAVVPEALDHLAQESLLDGVFIITRDALLQAHAVDAEYDIDIA